MAEEAFTRRSRDSIANTLIVAISLSLVCSVLVAGAAVLLKPRQLQNEEDYRQRIILDVAGLYRPDADAAELFAGIDTRLVDLASGDYVNRPDAQGFDPVAAADDPQLGMAIPPELDIAGIHRRSIYAPVYLVMDGEAISQIILPIYGSGLWSTMYGYLSLESDGNTVRGLRFYSHGETPGLGDQVDRPSWRALWRGKKLRDWSGKLRIEVIRGVVAADTTGATGDTAYKVDGLSGATLTSRGVTNLVRYWAGDDAFGPYLARFRKKEEWQ